MKDEDGTEGMGDPERGIIYPPASPLEPAMATLSLVVGMR